MKFDAIPPGVAARHRASIESPPGIPDLIGIREQRYLDRTGLVNHRGIGDLMRYAALNNELDFFSQFGDFIPLGIHFRELRHQPIVASAGATATNNSTRSRSTSTR